LTVNTLELPSDTPSGDAVGGPFILSCSWCNWTSLDIGIKFEKHNNITGQLNRMRNGGKAEPGLKERESQVERLRREERSSPDQETSPAAKDTSGETDLAPDELFSRLNAFYRTQISEAWEPSLFGSYGASDMPFNSPGSISRLLNIYSGKKTKRQRPKPMREALTPAEGLRVFDAARDDGGDLARQLAAGWAGTTTSAQRAFQAPSAGLLPGGEAPRCVEDLRPAASQLRARRAKRCRACRTLLAKPEPRMSSSRWRIRVLALSYVPRLALRALDSSSSSALGAALSPHLVPLLAAAPPPPPAPLAPGAPHHFLLTVANPLFDPLRVTLATAPTTPGRVASRVTVLCPQFDVGANSDVWDEALSSSASAAGKRRSVAPGSAGAALGRLDEDGGAGGAGQRQVEAGKVWARGRNWTSVVVEIVPGRLPAADELAEDEDVLEVAVFVRAEYETEAAAGEDKAAGGGAGGAGSAAAGGAGGKEKREVAFWSVLGAGMIGR
jgi:dynactin-4